MPDSAPPAKPSRAQSLFKAASPDVRELVKRIIQKERQVQHMEGRRLLPGANGQGIHQALLEQIKTSVK